MLAHRGERGVAATAKSVPLNGVAATISFSIVSRGADWGIAMVSIRPRMPPPNLVQGFFACPRRPPRVPSRTAHPSGISDGHDGTKFELIGQPHLLSRVTKSLITKGFRDRS